jgi:hypothetical protein
MKRIMQTAAESVESWSELLLREDSGRRRHWLGAEPIDNGTEIDVLLDDGTRLRGSYEWSGMPARWPGLRVRLRTTAAAVAGRPVHAVVALPPQALCRFART